VYCGYQEIRQNCGKAPECLPRRLRILLTLYATPFALQHNIPSDSLSLVSPLGKADGVF